MNPARRNIMFVTRLRKDTMHRGSRQGMIVKESFMVDPPGSWDDEKWNCHVDGCDNQFDTLEEALKCGADVLDFDPFSQQKPGYEFEYVCEPYDWQHQEPQHYGIAV